MRGLVLTCSLLPDDSIVCDANKNVTSIKLVLKDLDNINSLYLSGALGQIETLTSLEIQTFFALAPTGGYQLDFLLHTRLPAEIARLTNLKVLKLGYNNLFGKFEKKKIEGG